MTTRKLKIRKLKNRPWPVTVRLYEGDEEGVVTETEYTFVAFFKPLTEAEYKEVYAEVDALFPPSTDGTRNIVQLLERNAALFARLLDGWKGVDDEDDAVIPYSEERLRAMTTGLDGIAFSAGFHSAINEVRYGSAPRKNSATSLGAGPAPAPDEAATS